MNSTFDFKLYINYRQLLADYISFRKQQGHVFSYRWYSNKAGYSAPNFLKLIIDGSRNLTPDATEKLFRVFKWKEPDRKYFRLLVNYSQSKDLERKSQLANEIAKLRSSHPMTELRNPEFEYYSQWYHIPLRELILCNTQSMSKEQIANRLRPKITTAQVNRGLQILLELDLIRKKGNWYEVTNQQISTGDEPDQFIVASYHLENMELAKQSITRFESEQREISSSTLTLTPGKAKEAKKLVQEFHRRLFELETNEPGREVYQFNFQMFPLTESKK